MLCLSQTTGYAIKALGCLTAPGVEWQFIADVARCTGVPRAYLAKIMNSLARQGLVTARRGPSGGIALARPATDISLLSIVEAVEGKEWLGPCLLAIDECALGHGCPTHGFWNSMREQIREKLQLTTLAEVMAATPARQTVAPPEPPRPSRRGRRPSSTKTASPRPAAARRSRRSRKTSRRHG
jgi:Rrf2 family protein